MTGKELSELLFQLRCNCIENEETIREECNLSPVEFRALTSLEISDRVSAAEFAEKLDLSPSRVSRVIDRMVKMGSIAVETSASDRRCVFISLSETGVSQKAMIENAKERCNALLETKLSSKERQEISSALKKFLAAMNL